MVATSAVRSRAHPVEARRAVARPSRASPREGRCPRTSAAARSSRWRRRGGRRASGAACCRTRPGRSRRRTRAPPPGRAPRPRGSRHSRASSRARRRPSPASSEPPSSGPSSTRTTSAPSSAARSAAAMPASPPPITSTSAWRRRYSVRHSRSRLAAAQPAEAGGVAQDLLVQRPQPPRPDERLVVEARRGQAGRRTGRWRASGRSRATGSRSCASPHALADRLGAGPHPGPAVDVDEAVGALAGAAEQAAGAVVLEAAREDLLAGRVQRRADRVALERLDRLAVEAERDGPRAVDPLAGAAGGGGSSLAVPGSPTQLTSLVVVSRSARNQARQPGAVIPPLALDPGDVAAEVVVGVRARAPTASSSAGARPRRRRRSR